MPLTDRAPWGSGQPKPHISPSAKTKHYLGLRGPPPSVLWYCFGDPQLLAGVLHRLALACGVVRLAQASGI
jgi:hypothetical protein